MNTLTPSFRPISASGIESSPTENTIGIIRWTEVNSSTVIGTACWPIRYGAVSCGCTFQSAWVSLESGSSPL